jgi:pimeloyl-ACP methyl ester carboxylesterase
LSPGQELAVTEKADEAKALVRLGFDELSRIPGGIWGTHKAVASRAFKLTPGPIAKLVEVAHNGISGAVYGSLRAGTHTLGMAASGAVRSKPGRVVSTTPLGGAVIGVIDGLIGDALERDGSALSEPLCVRVGDRPVPPQREELQAAFPNATRKLVVFVHGLMGTELYWNIGARKGVPSYGDRLESELGFTPVYIRYNTGRHISENGRSLADVLEQVVAEWPVEVDEVALIGHSMGGLVCRSACHQAALDDFAWTKRVRQVVSLGTPHLGAPLAQGVHYLTYGLNKLPETRPFGAFFGRRSSGIRDLRQGSLVDADWRDRDPEALAAVACEEVPLLEGATHCFVAATITQTGLDPLGRIIGDTLVLQPSASGRSKKRRIPFEEEYGLHVGRTHHVALLSHPAVYEKLAEWLRPQPDAVSGAGTGVGSGAS